MALTMVLDKLLPDETRRRPGSPGEKVELQKALAAPGCLLTTSYNIDHLLKGKAKTSLSVTARGNLPFDGKAKPQERIALKRRIGSLVLQEVSRVRISPAL
jgi:hypothetical protein